MQQRPTARVYRCGWEKGAHKAFTTAAATYTTSAADIFTNGFRLAYEIQTVATARPAATLICVGHSLGAHSCGMAGKMFKKGVYLGANADERKLSELLARTKPVLAVASTQHSITPRNAESDSLRPFLNTQI